MSDSSHIVGKSVHAEQLRRALLKLSRERRHCIVIGEEGVGKTTFATEIGRDDSAFLVIDTAQMTEEELERHLAQCTQGTLFLERIDRSGFRSQRVILEFLERAGDVVRVLATSTASPEDLRGRGVLLDELYAKLLGFVSVTILPLRERPEDIPLLVRHFAPGLAIDINGLESLVRRFWRENIRELRQVVGKCVEHSHNGMLQLPDVVMQEQPEIVRVVSGILRQREQELGTSLDGLERGILSRTLERSGFDFSKAASLLGMTIEEFELKARRLGLRTAGSR